MVYEQLSDVFVASGVTKVNDKTFTALYHGYNLRGKIVVPTSPVIDFIFYGYIQAGYEAEFSAFCAQLAEKHGTFPIRMTQNSISVLLDIGTMKPEDVKAILGEVSGFMMKSGFAVINIPPEPPEPKPEPQPTQKKQAAKPQSPKQQPQPKREPPRPPEPPKIPFEEHYVLFKLCDIFVMGINKVSEDTFTTVFHGYNISGKMTSAMEERVVFTFYGQPLQNIAEEFEKFRRSMTEEYGGVLIRGVGGSLEITCDFTGMDADVCKAMLGKVSGFMMANNIAAINLPSGIPKGTPYVKPDRPTTSLKTQQLSQTQRTQRQTASTGSLGNNGQTAQATQLGYAQSSNQAYGMEDDTDSFVYKFLKKFGKK